MRILTGRKVKKGEEKGRLNSLFSLCLSYSFSATHQWGHLGCRSQSELGKQLTCLYLIGVVLEFSILLIQYKSQSYSTYSRLEFAGEDSQPFAISSQQL